MSVKPDFINKYYSYIGEKYNSLTIIDVAGNDTNGHYFFKCQCDCGNITKVRVDRILKGYTTTCGCRNQGYNYHDGNGLSKEYPKLYSVWNTIRHRCYNPKHCKYKNYGGRGITVCEEWRYEFTPFYNWAMANGYQDGLTIDRINVNGNYEPTNCRWVTLKEQARNKTNSVLVTYKEKTKSLPQWCEELNLPYKTIDYRLRAGWTAERAFTEPIKHYLYKNKK